MNSPEAIEVPSPSECSFGPDGLLLRGFYAANELVLRFAAVGLVVGSTDGTSVGAGDALGFSLSAILFGFARGWNFRSANALRATKASLLIDRNAGKPIEVPWSDVRSVRFDRWLNNVEWVRIVFETKGGLDEATAVVQWSSAKRFAETCARHARAARGPAAPKPREPVFLDRHFRGVILDAAIAVGAAALLSSGVRTVLLALHVVLVSRIVQAATAHVLASRRERA